MSDLDIVTGDRVSFRWSDGALSGKGTVLQVDDGIATVQWDPSETVYASKHHPVSNLQWIGSAA